MGANHAILLVPACSHLCCHCQHFQLCSSQSTTHHDSHTCSQAPPCRLGAGEGVTTDLAIAHDLYQRAAELGDPDAQADMAVRLALGLRPRTGAGSPNYGLTSPDVPAALLNYFFAAAGKDSFAQMALGYRHMYGVDVPQNCHAGLLYYNPVAEEVIEAARYPGHLPQVMLSTWCEAIYPLPPSTPSMQAVAAALVAQSCQVTLWYLHPFALARDWQQRSERLTALTDHSQRLSHHVLLASQAHLLCVGL